MENKLTVEEYEFLKGYETELTYAKGRVVVGVPMLVKKRMFEIYNRIRKSNNANYNCPNCVLNVLSACAGWYDEYIPIEEPPIEEPPAVKEPTTDKPKKGKKNDNK